MKLENYIDDAKGVLNTLLAFIFMSPFIYGLFRVFAGCLYWLRFGYWRDYSTCATFGMLCNNDTGFVGVNMILDWFGQHDLFYMLIIIPIVGSLFFLQSKN
jgi:hypothetical protein